MENREMETVTLDGKEVDFDAAINLMDDTIREDVHAALAPCSKQEFLDACVDRYEMKYGEPFQVA